MRSFRTNKIDSRKATYLNLAGQIESQLRDAYAKRFEDGDINQTILAEKIGVGRSAINKKLRGITNMTVSSIADLVWAMGYRIKVSIHDPANDQDGTRFPEQTADAVVSISKLSSSRPAQVAGIRHAAFPFMSGA